jgi:DNA repair protein RecO (recombination protein O)
MKTHISPSIIMRTKEFGEADLLVTFFTPDKGRLKGVAKGARRSRKRFVNCLDIFSLVKLEYSLKREGGLYFLHSGKLINAFPELRSDFGALSKASYMVELTEILFPLGVADREMFELLKGSLDSLANEERINIIPIIFGVRAMECEQESAVSPGVNPETVKVIKRIQSGPLTTLKGLKLTDEMIREIKPVLQRHKDYHLGQRLKTAAYLE